jgi:hypothetical protein
MSYARLGEEAVGGVGDFGDRQVDLTQELALLISHTYTHINTHI